MYEFNKWQQLLIIVVLLFLLEQFIPLKNSKKIFREGLFQDIFIWIMLFDFLVYPFIEDGYESGLYGALKSNFSENSFLNSFSVNQLHWSIQFAVVFCVLELINYLAHRYLSHSVYLWDFHKTHHATKEMDQFSDARHHPLLILLDILLLTVPVLLILNPSQGIMGAYAVMGLLWGPLIHHNLALKWPFPFSHILTSPHTHRWHHAKEKGVYCNYAGIFIFYDVLFGTFYSPQKNCEEIGFEGDEEYLRSPVPMILYPFKRMYLKLRRVPLRKGSLHE